MRDGAGTPISIHGSLQHDFRRWRKTYKILPGKGKLSPVTMFPHILLSTILGFSALELATQKVVVHRPTVLVSPGSLLEMQGFKFAGNAGSKSS